MAFWRVEWSMVGRERVVEEDEDLADPASISNPEDAGEPRFYRRKQAREDGRQSFIE
jgi:hypothetical protein